MSNVSVMRLSFKFLLVFLFAALCFGAGSLYQWLDLWFKHPVEIIIHNQSGQSIRNLNLSFSSGIKGTLVIPPPQDGKSVRIQYYPWGEGSFLIEATLESGQIVKHTEGYVEAGYTFDKVLTRNAIKNKL